MAATASYWCYRCNRSIRVCCDDVDHNNSSSLCPHCHTGFIEALEPNSAPSSPENRSRHERRLNFGFRRSRRTNSSGTPADLSLFNPVVIMRSPPGDHDAQPGGAGGDRSFQLYYDQGAGSGLRPLPPTMSQLLLGSRFDRLLDQLAQLDLNRSENPPASKSAIELMPTVEIDDTHVSADLHCAICKEAFVLGGPAREMPCKHLYHSDCILPWLAMRNSCPICRHELPGDQEASKGADPHSTQPFGLTIWRLPGGGYAVGRFSGTTTPAGDESPPFPVVYTEMDGGVNNNAAAGSPRRIVWGTRRRRSSSSTRNRNNNNGTVRFFSNIVSCLRRFMSSSTSVMMSSTSTTSTTLESVNSRA